MFVFQIHMISDNLKFYSALKTVGFMSKVTDSRTFPKIEKFIVFEKNQVHVTATTVVPMEPVTVETVTMEVATVEADNTTDCELSIYGCCPDNITAARGQDFQGCDNEPLSCEETTYGCCADGNTTGKRTWKSNF